MERTFVRQLDTTLMVVGRTTPNATRVTATFEQARLRVVRVGSAEIACEKLASTMPQVVVITEPLEREPRAELLERAEAVGAIVLDVDESLDGEEYETVVGAAITTAILRKLEQESAAAAGGAEATDGDDERTHTSPPSTGSRKTLEPQRPTSFADASLAELAARAQEAPGRAEAAKDSDAPPSIPVDFDEPRSGTPTLSPAAGPSDPPEDVDDGWER